MLICKQIVCGYQFTIKGNYVALFSFLLFGSGFCTCFPELMVGDIGLYVSDFKKKEASFTSLSKIALFLSIFNLFPGIHLYLTNGRYVKHHEYIRLGESPITSHLKLVWMFLDGVSSTEIVCNVIVNSSYMYLFVILGYS